MLSHKSNIHNGSAITGIYKAVVLSEVFESRGGLNVADMHHAGKPVELVWDHQHKMPQ